MKKSLWERVKHSQEVTNLSRKWDTQSLKFFLIIRKPFYSFTFTDIFYFCFSLSGKIIFLSVFWVHQSRHAAISDYRANIKINPNRVFPPSSIVYHFAEANNSQKNSVGWRNESCAWNNGLLWTKSIGMTLFVLHVNRSFKIASPGWGFMHTTVE